MQQQRPTLADLDEQISPDANVGFVRSVVVAAIDVGSQAARLRIARGFEDGTLTTLHRERDAVRVGERVFIDGVVGEAAVARLTETLAGFASRCRRHGVERMRAVATSALRTAANANDVVARAREAGVALEVIDACEEARLVARGVLRREASAKDGVILDVGGGSTEVIVARARATKSWSIEMGALRLSEARRTATFDRDALVRMRRAAQHAFSQATLPPSAQSKRAHGSSGTIRGVARFARGSETATLSREDVSRAVEELFALGPKRVRAIDKKRGDTLVAGAVVIEAAMHELGIEALTSVDAGIREGILAELARPR